MSEPIKAGDFLYLGWGATMRGYNFYQVLKVDKSKIYLATPQTESTGNQEGEVWISAPAQAEEVTHHAKIVRGKIKLCSPDFKVSSSYWNTLRECELAKKFHYYGD